MNKFARDSQCLFYTIFVCSCGSGENYVSELLKVSRVSNTFGHFFIHDDYVKFEILKRNTVLHKLSSS